MRHSSKLRIATALAALALAAAATGCGSKSGAGDVSPRDGATISVTRDFGARELKPARTIATGGDLSAMRQLQAVAETETSYGGRYVTAIDGLEQDLGGGYDWLFYVDGVESDAGAAAVDLTAGQVVQWDYHRWRDVKTGGAIVGAFPAPFADRGAALECVPRVSAACVEVKRKLREAMIRLNTKGVALKVGTWTELARRDLGVDLSEDPAGNGAFSAFSGDRELQLVADDGNVAQTLGPRSGLIAAFAKGGEPLWIVTGVDTLGVEAAAGALSEKQLARRFALAVADEGSIALPIVKDAPPK